MFSRVMQQKHPQNSDRHIRFKGASEGRDDESIESYRSVEDFDDIPLGPVSVRREQPPHNPAYAAEALYAVEQWNYVLLRILLRAPKTDADMGQELQLDAKDQELIEDALRYVQFIQDTGRNNVEGLLKQAFPKRYHEALLANDAEQLRALFIEALSAPVDFESTVDSRGNNLLHRAMGRPKKQADDREREFLLIVRFLFAQPGAERLLLETNRDAKRPYDYVGSLGNNVLAQDVVTLMGGGKVIVDTGPAFYTKDELDRVKGNEVAVLKKARAEIKAYREIELPKRKTNPFVTKRRTDELTVTVTSLALALENANTAKSWFIFKKHLELVKSQIKTALYPMERSYLLNALVRIEQEAQKLLAAGEQPWHLTEQVTQLMAFNEDLEKKLFKTEVELEHEEKEKEAHKAASEEKTRLLGAARDEVAQKRGELGKVEAELASTRHTLVTKEHECAAAEQRALAAEAELADLRARELERQRAQELTETSFASTNSRPIPVEDDTDSPSSTWKFKTVDETPVSAVQPAAVHPVLTAQALSTHDDAQNNAGSSSVQERTAAMQATAEDDGLSALDSIVSEPVSTRAMVARMYTDRAPTPAPVQMAQSFHSDSTWDGLDDEINGSSSQAAAEAKKKEKRSSSPSF